VLDFFAGSGTMGDAAARHGRGFLLVDSNPEAVNISAARLAEYQPRTRASSPLVAWHWRLYSERAYSMALS
jgi:DNA modification methylase